jgi:hypothetical protein
LKNKKLSLKEKDIYGFEKLKYLVKNNFLFNFIVKEERALLNK